MSTYTITIERYASCLMTWIEAAHRRLARFRSDAIRRVAMNRDTVEDFEQVEREFHDLVDFYRWIRPHVSLGGVFYVEDGK